MPRKMIPKICDECKQWFETSLSYVTKCQTCIQSHDCEVCSKHTTVMYQTPLGVLCSTHHKRFLVSGTVRARTTHSPNDFIDCGDYIEIVLFDNAANEVGRGIVDKADEEIVKKYKWIKLYNRVATSQHTKNRLVYLHRILMQPTEDDFVGFRDEDGMNCRRNNLYIAVGARQNNYRK